MSDDKRTMRADCREMVRRGGGKPGEANFCLRLVTCGNLGDCMAEAAVEAAKAAGEGGEGPEKP